MTAVNGAFDTVVDAETLEESPPAAEELGSCSITTDAEHYCLRVKSGVYTVDRFQRHATKKINWKPFSGRSQENEML